MYGIFLKFILCFHHLTHFKFHSQGVDFLTFSTHMSLGIIFVMVQSYLQLRLKFRSISDLRLSEPQDVQNLRKQIANWQRAASSLISYTKDESILHIALQNKINHLQYQLQEKLSTGSISKDAYEQTLLDLQEKVCKQSYIQ